MELIKSEFSINEFYTSRATRSEFVVKQFGSDIGATVLDVGSSGRDLEKMLHKFIIDQYTSVDLNTSADYNINLDKQELPFTKNSFDTIVCTDVLEHLENIHGVFNQLLKISNKNIILSLPNAWFDFKKNIFLAPKSGKFYGLPENIPDDRHRWLFNFSEAENFVRKNSLNASKITVYPYFNPTNKAIKLFFKKMLTYDKFLNLFSPALWAKIEK